MHVSDLHLYSAERVKLLNDIWHIWHDKKLDQHGRRILNTLIEDWNKDNPLYPLTKKGESEFWREMRKKRWNGKVYGVEGRRTIFIRDAWPHPMETRRPVTEEEYEKFREWSQDELYLLKSDDEKVKITEDFFV